MNINKNYFTLLDLSQSDLEIKIWFWLGEMKIYLKYYKIYNKLFFLFFLENDINEHINTFWFT